MGFQDRGGFGGGPREMHKAICADCKKECEVPFKPSGERPVFCRDCFSKRRTGNPSKEKYNNTPRGESFSRPPRVEKPHDGEKKKFYERKRPAAKKRRKK